MKIVFLDAKTIGDDIDLSGYDALGEVVKYGFSTPEEARERTKDADVIVLNKVVINEQSIGEAEHLKLVCVTATGTNNLDKEYLDQRGIAWRNVAGYSTETVAQHTFALLFYLLEKLHYYDEYVKSEKYVGDVSFTHFDNVFHELSGKAWARSAEEWRTLRACSGAGCSTIPPPESTISRDTREWILTRCSRSRTSCRCMRRSMPTRKGL